MLELKLNDRGATISPGIFGVLIEPYGTTLDGVWVGEDSSIPNDGGLRLDTIDAFRRLEISVIRGPGGTFADTYHWEDGIGPRSERPRTWNYFFGGEETNEFGTDEFLRFCELVGAEAGIKLNPLTGTLGEAIKWMQYCNHKGNTTLTDLRRRNGHPEPYGVKYWSIGNEAMDSFWPEGYAERVHQWVFFVRQVCPDARIVVSGSTADWNERFLARFAELRQNAAICTKGMIHTIALKYTNEELIKETGDMLDEYMGPDEDVDIAVEEWCALRSHEDISPPEFRGDLPIHEVVLKAGQQTELTYEGVVTLVAALGGAFQLHGFMRNADRVKLATLLYPTNTWGPLVKTDGPRFIRTANYHVLELLMAHKGAELIEVELDEKDRIDAVASASKDGRRITVSLLSLPPLHNPSRAGKTDQAVEVRIRVKGDGGRLPGKAKATILTGNPGDQNTFEDPDRVKPGAGEIRGTQDEWIVLCEPYSLTVVTFEK